MECLGENMTNHRRKIDINELPKIVPDYKNSTVSKEILTEQ